MASLRTALLGLSALTLAACASSDLTTPRDYSDLPPQTRQLMLTLAAFDGDYDVSTETMRTAVIGEDGKPVGLLAYAEPSDAIRAGDTAAFIAAIKATRLNEDDTSEFPNIVESIDLAAGGDFQGAIDLLETAVDDRVAGTTATFLKAWYLAMNDEGDKAISVHRRVSGDLPGLTGDLSLAAMLEALGRTSEALAVYDTMTPKEIKAPDHDFDAQNLVFSHVQLVIARQALLLRREGRIEDAQNLYRRLAAAEPERAISYAAAVESLATGRGLDDESVTLKSGFSQSLTDYSRSLATQRIITGIMMGNRQRGFDDTRGAFDQLALLVDQDNDDLRLSVFDQLYDEALYDGALHILRSAPEATSSLKMAEAGLLVRMQKLSEVDAALQSAITLADADKKLSTNSSAMRLYSLMENQDKALTIAATLPDLAETDAERATALGLTSAVYAQFARYDDALANSRAARAIDDTHDRRMALTNALADAGKIGEGLELLRSEALTRPNDPYMLNTLGYYLVEHTGRLDEAFRVLARASALAPNDPYIADSFGWVRFALGDLDGARRYIELSRRELAPNKHWEIEDHLGDIYWHLDRKDDAKEAWGNALKEFPPESKRAIIESKLANGITEPAPEKQELPDVSISRDAEIDRKDI
jgi:tetratricopeptide (TPR) repeat protein